MSGRAAAVFLLVFVPVVILSWLIRSAGQAGQVLARGPAGGTSQGVEFIGQVGGWVYSVAQEGDYAYVGVGPRLVILDVSDPSLPVQAGSSDPLPGIVYDVAISGTYAYVANGEGGLRIFDVANPAAPVEVGSYVTGDEAISVAIAGDFAYISSGGLHILDIADPTTPVQVGFYGQSGNNIAVSDQHVYFLSGAYPNVDLHVVSVVNPALPIQVATYYVPGGITDFVLDGNYAYVSHPGFSIYDYPAGLRIVDISIPSSPQEIGYYETSTSGDAVAVADSNAYLVTSAINHSDLVVVNVSNPVSPTQVGLYEGLGEVEDLAIGAGILLAAEISDYEYQGGGLRLLDVADAANPVEVSFYDTVEPWWFSGLGEIIASDSYVYSFRDSTNFRVFNATDPAAPTIAVNYGSPWYLQDLAVSGTYAYAAAGPDGLRILDVSDAFDPAEVGSYTTPGSIREVVVQGNYAYLGEVDETPGSNGGALRIIDISDPLSPTQAGLYEPGGLIGVWQLAVEGDYAYLLTGGDGGVYNSIFYVVDVSDPTNPVEIGLRPSIDYYHSADLAVSGSYAYLLRYQGIAVLDVSVPMTPTEIGFYEQYGEDLDLAGDYAYVIDPPNGLRIIDVSNPLLLAEVASYNTPYLALNVAVQGPIVYVADQEGGFYTLWFNPPVSAAIPASGGALVSPLDGTTYTFPAGTFTDTVIVTHTPRFHGSLPPTGDLVGIGHSFEVTAVYSSTGQPAQPVQPYTITIGYSEAEKGPAIEDTLALYYWNGNQWLLEPGSLVDTAANTIIATPNHFSAWAVLGEVFRFYLPIVRKN
ncbi:MAG: hypothetical protein L0332_10910 [Chloroflexi bacterium]|nr:hypothetical protein [Chloroflexota bacterium]MCI0578518.1 hypothetical protein [Chloroflexota bacterium]MCI0647192.1 hypothetical protein [Chloroflexota bacterium]MCI0727217.1 hypothetical protein [Chloroflexota bacterium]